MTSTKPDPQEIVQLIDECRRQGATVLHLNRTLREAGLSLDEAMHAVKMVALAYQHAVEGGVSGFESDPYFRAATQHALSLRKPWWKFW